MLKKVILTYTIEAMVFVNEDNYEESLKNIREHVEEKLRSNLFKIVETPALSSKDNGSKDFPFKKMKNNPFKLIKNPSTEGDKDGSK